MNAHAGSRLAVLGADGAFHARLRASFGLSPSAAALDVPRGLAYCGADYRVYPFMRIADAVRFFAAIHDRWDTRQLEADFKLAGLGPAFEVRRMKRAFQRALVLALSCAPSPQTLVVEAAEEFEEAPGAAALFAHALERAPTALATFGGDARPGGTRAAFTRIVSSSEFETGARA